MTRDVVTAAPDTSVEQLALLLTGHRISGVPVTDDHDRVLGVVSEADLLPRVAAGGSPPRRRRGAAKAVATRAGEVMTARPVTIAAHEPLAAAARKMQAKKVKRLLVTGDDGELVGIVSRTDLLRPFTRADEAIRHDIVDDVLRRALWIGADQVQVRVDGGVATLTGAVGRRTTAAIAARLAGTVPGVVTVINRIGHDFDDTALANSRVSRTHPFSADPFRP